MLTLATLALWAPLLQGPLDYTGRYQGDERLKALVPDLERALEEAADEIPDWLTDKPPGLAPRLVDLDAPPVWDTWPTAIFQGNFKVDRSDRKRIVRFDLPVDPLLGDPSRCRASVVRQLVFGITTMRAMGDGLALGRHRDFGMNNPVIYALGSHLAGELDRELEFTLRKHLESDEELEGLFADLAPSTSKSGYWQFEDRPDDDVTFLFLVRHLTPKGKDKKLAALIEAIFRGKDVEDSIKKATRKSLRKFNSELRKAFLRHLDDLFPEEERTGYRELLAKVEDGAWEEAVALGEGFVERHPDSLATPNARYLTARALAEYDPDRGAHALTEAARQEGPMSPMAWDAQLRLGLLEKERGRTDAARAAFQRLRSDFAWVPGCWERAEHEWKRLEADD